LDLLTDLVVKRNALQYGAKTDATFADNGLTSATDAVTFDAVAMRIHDTDLPKLCTPLQHYYSDKLEPMLCQNMEASCADRTNNAADSINHTLKQRVQWHVSQMPELIGKCRQLVDAQHTEADRALMGCGVLALRKGYACHGATGGHLTSGSHCQSNRSSDCATSVSASSRCTCLYRQTDC